MQRWRRGLPRGVLFAVWAALAATNGLADALHTTGDPFRTVTSVALWSIWLVGLVAIVLPGAAALTIVRIVVPAAVPATAWAAGSVTDASLGDHGPSVALAVIATALSLAPITGERFVDAAGYGDERRFLLRPPAPTQVVAAPIAWAVAVVGLTTGPLLLADEHWIAGPISAAVGLPLGAIAARALYGLTRRWLVMVPAGLVVHDHITLQQPVLLTRNAITALGPAPADTAALDLTAQAGGLALELRLTDPVEIPLLVDRVQREDTPATAVLVVPTRPAAVMATAAERRIRIG